jgi:hypothetical protein
MNQQRSGERKIGRQRAPLPGVPGVYARFCRVFLVTAGHVNNLSPEGEG